MVPTPWPNPGPITLANDSQRCPFWHRPGGQVIHLPSVVYTRSPNKGSTKTAAIDFLQQSPVGQGKIAMDDQTAIAVDIQEVIAHSVVLRDHAQQTRRTAQQVRIRTREILEQLRELRTAHASIRADAGQH